MGPFNQEYYENTEFDSGTSQAKKSVDKDCFNLEKACLSDSDLFVVHHNLFNVLLMWYLLNELQIFCRIVFTRSFQNLEILIFNLFTGFLKIHSNHICSLFCMPRLLLSAVLDCFFWNELQLFSGTVFTT